MTDSHCELSDYQQSINHWIEYVPRQNLAASISPSAVTVSRTHSRSQETLAIPSNKNANDPTLEPPNTLPEQQCEDSAYGDQPEYDEQEPTLCQATKDIHNIETTVKSAPSQPNTYLEQSLETDSNTDKPQYSVEKPSLCLATGDSGMINEGTPSEPDINLLQPDNADTSSNKPIYRPLASLLFQTTDNTLTTIRDVSRERNTHSRIHTDKPKTPPQGQFVSDIGGNSQLTVEDIYIEAMTLDAEIRINRRQLGDRGKTQLSKILQFCHNALHEKLLLNSMAKQVHGKIRQHR